MIKNQATGGRAAAAVANAARGDTEGVLAYPG